MAEAPRLVPRPLVVVVVDVAAPADVVAFDVFRVDSPALAVCPLVSAFSPLVDAGSLLAAVPVAVLAFRLFCLDVAFPL